MLGKLREQVHKQWTQLWVEPVPTSKLSSLTHAASLNTTAPVITCLTKYLYIPKRPFPMIQEALLKTLSYLQIIWLCNTPWCSVKGFPSRPSCSKHSRNKHTNGIQNNGSFHRADSQPSAAGLNDPAHSCNNHREQARQTICPLQTTGRHLQTDSELILINKSS